jgi:hypothetical protein
VAAALACATGVLAPALAPSHPARAALLSPAMTYTGSTGCPGSQAAQVTILADTGESHTWGTVTAAPLAPGAPGDYEMTFGYIPLSGIGATAWVRCASAGGFTQRVFLPRPLFEDSARVDLG